jgi:DNA helicase-2/ATP-dependent DNA helicase PcrA
MSAQNHPAYPEELARLDYTLNFVAQNLDATSTKKQMVDKAASRAKKGYQQPDSSQEYMDLLLNAALQSAVNLKLRNLESARHKPYFARVDFNETGKPETEHLYIGKMCLAREEDQKLVIVDWRAPVSNLYYEGRLGPAVYECPAGEISGELRLKRQFSINDGVLDAIFDIDITTNDQFLQSYLGANADNRLKEIVATIQAEQNRIIRASMEKPLIVQGVAGSGKTTIALHRIAYLIYNHSQSFQPENFMIVAPNRLFLDYISDVLPELGVERVKQTTFEDFAVEAIGEPVKIRDGNEKLLRFLENSDSREDELKKQFMRETAEFKASLALKDMLAGYIIGIENSLLPEGDLTLDNLTIYTYGEIRDLYYRDYRDWPIYRRLEQLKKHFNKRMKERRQTFIEKLQNACHLNIERIKLVMADSEERQQMIIKAIDTKNESVKKIDRLAAEGIKVYFQRIQRLSCMQYYQQFFTEYFTDHAGQTLSPELIAFIRESTMKNLQSGYVEIEDVAPVLYLKYRLYGLDEKIRVKHIVIDEAQDFSLFQFYALKKLIKDSSFTVLGDLAQGIHSYRGMKDWESLLEQVFDGQADLVNLEQSYRTTVEIMEAANLVISQLPDYNLIKAKPVIRHGEPVKMIVTDDEEQMMADIWARLSELRHGDFKSVAVICKTETECLEVHSYLKKQGMAVPIITGKENEYHSGVVIVPVYLAKGLEFDVVMLVNVDDQRYGMNELDIKLLYVAMTRPLHLLYVYCCGETAELLRGRPA